MRDPFSWSLPCGRLFGITIRVHLLFPLFILVMWLRAATGKDLAPGSANAMLWLMGLAFLAVLFHEFGHCYAGYRVGGEPKEVLLWPLGGLASCNSLPNTPRAHFLFAAGGPAANLLLCGVITLIMAAWSFQPNFDPTFDQCWQTKLYNFSDGKTYGSEFAPAGTPRLEFWQMLLAQFFWVNWFQFLLNVLLIGFPLDGGQMFQAALWPRLGYRQSMMVAIVAGFIVMFLVAIYGMVYNGHGDTLLLCLAAFIYFSCKYELVKLETGGEESLFGYDFSQGYTSLERSQQPEPAAPPRKKLNFFQRWLQRRAAKKIQKEQEQSEADDRRMDELLDKIQRLGKTSLTDDEQRFLKRMGERYRNRP